MDQLQNILSLYPISTAKVFLKYGIGVMSPEYLALGVAFYGQPFIDDMKAQVQADYSNTMQYAKSTNTGSNTASAVDVGAVLGTVLDTVLNVNQSSTTTTTNTTDSSKGYTIFIVAGVFLIALLAIILITRKHK